MGECVGLLKHLCKHSGTGVDDDNKVFNDQYDIKFYIRELDLKGGSIKRINASLDCGRATPP